MTSQHTLKQFYQRFKEEHTLFLALGMTLMLCM